MTYLPTTMSKRTNARGRKITIQFYLPTEDRLIRDEAKHDNRSVADTVRLLALEALRTRNATR